MNETSLCTFFEISKRSPGWLSKMTEVFSLNEKEVGFLEWLDDQELKINKKIRAMEAQMYRDGMVPELIDCETDEERMQRVNKLIFTIEDCHREMREADASFYERALALIASRYEHWVKLRNKLRARMVHVRHPEYSQITESDIVRAREYPLENLVDLNRSKHMLCPFHDDKSPSMWVKNGYGWCFSCGAWCDSIKYLVEVQKVKFSDAVMTLSRAA